MRMSDETDNLVLEHLRHIRATCDRVDHRIDELILRMSAVEQHPAGLHLSSAQHARRLDRNDERLDQIERRLELREAD